MIYEIIKPMKERVRFLVEHQNLFNVKMRESSNQIMSETYGYSLSDKSQQVLEKHNCGQIETQSTTTVSSNYQADDPALYCLVNSDIISEVEVISSKEDESKENDVDAEESTFPYTYVIPDLPLKVQQYINKGEINEFRGHTNARRLLLDTIFNDVTTNYSLL